MGRLLVDPFVLALPLAETADAIDDYTARLLALDDLHRRNLCDFFLTTRAGEVLLQTHSYPLWDALGGVAAGYRRDIVRIVYAFLDRLAPLEEAAGVDDLLVDECDSDPRHHLADRASEFVDVYHRILALAYLVNDRIDAPCNTDVVFTRGIGAETAQPIRGRGRLLEVQWTAANDRRADAQLPRDFSFETRAMESMCALSLACDPVDAWTRGLFRDAVDLAVVQRCPEWAKRARTQWPQHDRPWVLGADLAASARRTHVDRDPMLLRALLEACASTVLGTASAQTHRLRIAEGGAAPPRVRARDGAVGWRRDVTYDLHLHYWQTAEGPELASLVQHNDFTIPE